MNYQMPNHELTPDAVTTKCFMQGSRIFQDLIGKALHEDVDLVAPSALAGILTYPPPADNVGGSPPQSPQDSSSSTDRGSDSSHPSSPSPSVPPSPIQHSPPQQQTSTPQSTPTKT